MNKKGLQCFFNYASVLIMEVNLTMRASMANKPGLEQRSIGLEDSIWKWLEKKATDETRTVVGQIRHELNKNKRAEDKK